MANHRAIAAASAAIAGLLRDHYPRAVFGPSLDIAPYQARDVDDLDKKECIAVVLWRVAVNTSRRNMGPRTDALGRRFKPSLPLDLYYLIAPFAANAERQQRMLGWTLRALEDVGSLAATHLNHYLAESDVYAETESVDLMLDPLPLGDYLTLWDRLKKFPPSATYVLRMVLLDAELPLEEGPLVQERNLDMGVLTR